MSDISAEEHIRRTQAHLSITREKDFVYIRTLEFTPAFRGDVLPVRPGVYFVKGSRAKLIGFQYFDGESWYRWCPTIGWAYATRLHERFKDNAPFQWRGLTSQNGVRRDGLTVEQVQEAYKMCDSLMREVESYVIARLSATSKTQQKLIYERLSRKFRFVER